MKYALEYFGCNNLPDIQTQLGESYTVQEEIEETEHETRRTLYIKRNDAPYILYQLLITSRELFLNTYHDRYYLFNVDQNSYQLMDPLTKITL